MEKKNLFLMVLALVSAFVVTGCSNKSETPLQELSVNNLKVEEKISDFTLSVKENSSLVREAVMSNGYTRSSANSEEYCKDIEESLQPILKKSKSLLAEYGISDNDMREIFGENSDANSIILSIMVLDATNESTQSRSQLVNCALEALGIPAGMIMGSIEGGAAAVTGKAILKAAKKIATRTLGWIGAGIAIVEFASCMDYI